METAWNWFMESPYTHGLLIFSVANIIVQKTPFKQDDDILKMAQDIFMAILGKKG
ncbi:hypothetical protein HN911_12990 [Candidatus Bathyarchaeota archaeon]|jgi:hypothetical protein|nr:hypothetical protein [Candidatus Bathyarchaeota archaeon]MBT7914479.1 hypothetical protein [Candidatus Bathyarchaeota archaeon]